MKFVALSEDGEQVGVILSKEDAAIIASLIGPCIPHKTYERAIEYASRKMDGTYAPIEWEKDTTQQGQVVMDIHEPLHSFLKGHK